MNGHCEFNCPSVLFIMGLDMTVTKCSALIREKYMLCWMVHMCAM